MEISKIIPRCSAHKDSPSMQFVGRAIDSVSKTLSSINPSTLSGAIDVIVVESADNELNCSPFHVRFGKFQLLRPSQKKVDFIINGKLTNLPMKLGDEGEAFFVFETSNSEHIPNDMITSPVISAASSSANSPASSPPNSPRKYLGEPEFLDISSSSPTKNYEKFHKLSKKLTKVNIPSKIDNNGDLFLDINGYKSSEQSIHDTDEIIKNLFQEEFGNEIDLDLLIRQDELGNLKIFNHEELPGSTPPPLSSSSTSVASPASPGEPADDSINSLDAQDDSSVSYVKTLRLTSDQLKCLDLKPGENDLCFSVDQGKALITCKLFYWKSGVPIVISDIDGTITKSDALGHVLTMLGRDWTHTGVAKLFTDIELNGYHIMYLTARGVGQADSTRSYLKNVEQDGVKLPAGPVILSPDRTIAALRREVILRKPEVFKMSCLQDIKSLYSDLSPFYAGFGNRITDALSYRSVGIPSSRIFTINPDGEVHMELLELAGFKSSYVNIGELVDQFFPPVSGSTGGEAFTDLNYWREDLPSLSESEDEPEQATDNPQTSSGTNGGSSASNDSNDVLKMGEFEQEEVDDEQDRDDDVSSSELSDLSSDSSDYDLDEQLQNELIE